MHFIKLPEQFCGLAKSSIFTFPSHSSMYSLVAAFIEFPMNLAFLLFCFYLHITTILFLDFVKKAYISVPENVSV